jgi:multiple sugar transport system substrate-binding protein
MTKTRRSVTAVLALGVASLLLTACVGNNKTSSNSTRNASAKTVSLRISANDVVGGKNAAEAGWIQNYVIPGFEKAEKAKGVNVKVSFQGSGVQDTDYLTKLELGLKTNTAADIDSSDGIWLGELQGAGYIKPLTKVVGPTVNSWSGWKQIPASVKGNMEVAGQVYGIPQGTDGRVLYFNKKLFAQAGLPANWQPKSWNDILAAGRALKKISGVTPIQLDAGVPMGEATTTQGFLPLLAGTSDSSVYNPSTKKWQGATPQVTAALNFYSQIYGAGLGDPKLQEDQDGRNESFTEFSQNKIGILLESDYLWRSIICPQKSICNSTAMSDRNSEVGFAYIPNQNGGKYVSISGGGGWILNPGTKYPQQAWDLMTYMNSEAAVYTEAKNDIRITARQDVNNQLLKNDPLLSFISQKVLPVTQYRPSSSSYNAVSTAIQQATADVVSGKSAKQAASTYQASLSKIVGAANVSAG